MGSNPSKPPAVKTTSYRKTDTQTTSGTVDSASNKGENNETTKEQNEENDNIDRNGNSDVKNDKNDKDKNRVGEGEDEIDSHKRETTDGGDGKSDENLDTRDNSGKNDNGWNDDDDDDDDLVMNKTENDGRNRLGVNSDEGDNGGTNNNNGEDHEPKHAGDPSSETSDNLKNESGNKDNNETSGERTTTENGDKHYDGLKYEQVFRAGETIISNTHGNGHEKQTLSEKSDANGDNDGPDKADDKKSSERAVLYSVKKETAITGINDTSVNDNDNSHGQNERETSSAKQRKEAANKDAKLKATEQKTNPEKSNKPEKKIVDNGLNDNLDFYRDKIKSKPPPGYKISEMLKWKGDYKGLESRHTYIQWLFPIPEGSGMNSSAQALQEHEAEAIKGTTVLRKRVLQAFEMMLDFYGMVLQDKTNGRFERGFNWKERYEHLNKSSHNYLRITRILKCLGEVGYEHLQAPWVEFLMDEAEDEKALPRLTTSSAIEYWIHAIKDEEKQIEYLQRHEQIKSGSSATKTADKSKPNSIPTKPAKTDPPPTGASKPPAAKNGAATDKPQSSNTPNKTKHDPSNVNLHRPPENIMSNEDRASANKAKIDGI